MLFGYYHPINYPSSSNMEIVLHRVSSNYLKQQIITNNYRKILNVFYIKNFDSLSNNLKKNIVSSWYRGSLSGSPKTIRLINEGKFKEASIEFLNNAEYKAAVKSGSGVAKRMEDVANAIKMEALKKKEK